MMTINEKMSAVKMATEEMTTQEMMAEIARLKIEKNALILAHNYQIGDVQDVADIVGDSYMLSKYAQTTDKDVIVFCGVHFMAESAKILNPSKKILLPALDAGCPMADMITGEEIKKFKEANPGVPVVAYVNTSAEVKAYTDICCTSSNAVNVVKSLGAKKILFLPDRNLGHFIAAQIPETEIVLWDGFCITHERVEEEDVIEMKVKHPGVKLLIHPECNPLIVKHADFAGSTSQIIDFVKNSEDEEFIIGTEAGILHTLGKIAPNKKCHLLSKCLVCQNMKKTTLAHVLDALRYDQHEIIVDEEVRLLAEKSLIRMLEVNV